MQAITRSRSFRIFKWLLIITSCLFVAMILAVFLLAAPDLFRAVPIPEVVKKIAEERQTAEQKSGRANPPIALTTTSLSYDSVTSPSEPFLSESTNLPSFLNTHRQRFNDEFSSITRAMEKLRADLPELSYEESERRCESVSLALKAFVNSVFPENFWTDKNEKLRLDPAFQSITMKCGSRLAEVRKLYFEILVRHEKWAQCAYRCENDLYGAWPEAVYYWRRYGGFWGYYHIIGGSLYVRSVKYPLFDRIRNWLPYNASDLSPEIKRTMMKDREFYQLIKYNPSQ